MLCTCIYFVDIGSFDGEEMPTPVPHDPGVDPDDDQGYADAEDHQEANAERPAPAGAPVHGRLNDTRYRMELGDQFIALIFEESIIHTHYRDIEVDDRLLQMWRGMPCDMYSLMRHVVGVTTSFT